VYRTIFMGWETREAWARRQDQAGRASGSLRAVLRLGIDSGGTFTDVVAFDEGSGQRWTTKVASTPADPSIAFMDGVGKIARHAGFDLAEVVSVSHGTTVATNALLAQDGALPGLHLC
jgi:N-methylhydantoinase A